MKWQNDLAVRRAKGDISLAGQRHRCCRLRGRKMRRVGLALAVALLLTACVSAGEKRPTPTPTTQGVPPESYRRALAAATRTFEQALDSVAAATTYEALKARLDRASKASATVAARLNKTPVPADVRAEHEALVTAFRQLKGDIDFLPVDEQELCTASVVLPRVAKLAGFVAVRNAGRALAAKGGANGYNVELELPATPVVTGRRLATGQFVRPGSRTGRGVLKILNGPDGDAVVVLALGKRPVISVYVRKSSRFTVRGIRDGTYKIFMATGQDWDARAHGFARNCAFEQFDEPFKFWTSTTATRISWSVWTVDLGGGGSGHMANTPSSDVLPADFPA